MPYVCPTAIPGSGGLPSGRPDISKGVVPHPTSGDNNLSALTLDPSVVPPSELSFNYSLSSGPSAYPGHDQVLSLPLSDQMDFSYRAVCHHYIGDKAATVL